MAKPPKDMDERGRVWKGTSPATGTRTAVYHSDSAGFDSSGGAKYSVVCEDHGNILSTPSITAGKRAAVSSVDWCEDCRDAMDGRTAHFGKGASGI